MDRATKGSGRGMSQGGICYDLVNARFPKKVTGHLCTGQRKQLNFLLFPSRKQSRNKLLGPVPYLAEQLHKLTPKSMMMGIT